VPNEKWKTPYDGQRNCPKHVQFLDKNKFGKLMRLFLLKINLQNNNFLPTSSNFLLFGVIFAVQLNKEV
jgi:hypothetical protein